MAWGKANMYYPSTMTTKTGRLARKYKPRKKSVTAIVKREIARNEEHKFYDTVMTAALAANYTAYSLNCMVQGAGPSTRVGKKIAIHSVQLVGTVGCAITKADQVFMSIVVDKNAIGTNPALTDIWESEPYMGSLREMARSPDFTIIKQARWYAIGGTATGDQNNLRSINWFHKFKTPLIVDYNLGNAGTGADIDKNNLVFILTTQSYSNLGYHDLYARIRYTDA